jgi:hypothetical protein
MALLMVRGWFDEIYINCLPVEHTHEDIDQIFSNFNIHYWKGGLEGPLEMENFLDWAYPTPGTRPTFKWVEGVYGVTNWLENFGVAMKGHSGARSFKFSKIGGNVEMFYKQSPLDVTWIGLQSNPAKGIALFQIIPTLSSNPELLPLEPLDIDVIVGILGNKNMMKHLNVANKQWYLKLRANTMFYLSSEVPSYFPQQGPLMELLQHINVIDATSICRITVDEIQQAFLHNGVQESDVGSMVIADIYCGEAPFTLRKILEVISDQVKLGVHLPIGDLFVAPYEVAPSIRKTVSKNKIIRKSNVVTMRNKLTLGSIQLIKKKYSL